MQEANQPHINNNNNNNNMPTHRPKAFYNYTFTLNN
eukprot:SAG31_NODE_760_length_12279_cov_2.439655_10_plen_36_part_00